jgi:hypothetical protein
VAYVSKPQIEDAIVQKFPPPPSPKVNQPPIERRRIPPRPRDAGNAGDAADSDSGGTSENMGLSQNAVLWGEEPQRSGRISGAARPKEQSGVCGDETSRRRNVGGNPKLKT